MWRDLVGQIRGGLVRTTCRATINVFIPRGAFGVLRVSFQATVLEYNVLISCCRHPRRGGGIIVLGYCPSVTFLPVSLLTL